MEAAMLNLASNLLYGAIVFLAGYGFSALKGVHRDKKAMQNGLQALLRDDILKIRANATLAEELGYSAFIRYSDHSLVINNTTFVDGATNAVAVYDCLPNTKYMITMNMYSRFRVGSYAGVPASETVLTTYQCHTLDDNSTTSQNGSSQSMIFTTGASDTKLFIGYWTTTDTVKAAVIKPTINIDEYIAPPTMTANVALTSSGTTTSDSTHCVTDYIPISNSTSIKYSVGEDM